MSSALGKSGSTRAWRTLRALVLAEEPLCRWCGQPSTCVDHIVPRASGGTDGRANLAGSCQPCNLSRGARVASLPPSLPW